jgi:hypothetical protein
LGWKCIGLAVADPFWVGAAQLQAAKVTIIFHKHKADRPRQVKEAAKKIKSD